MAENEHVNEFNKLVTECDEKQVVPLMECVEERIREMRLTLADKIIACCRDSSASNSQCSPAIIALFLMAETVLHFNSDIAKNVMARLKEGYKSNVRNIDWIAKASPQVRQNLWVLFVERETASGFSADDYEKMLSDCFSALARSESHLLCLILWLFKEFATPERIDFVEEIVMRKPATSSLLDKMLLWHAQIRVSNCSQEKVREIETRICGLQLDSGAFATVEGKKEDGVLLPSAIGLLVLISCAKRKDMENQSSTSEGSIIDAVRKTVRWIVGRVTDVNDEGVAWAYYALCEYIDLESTTKKR